MGGRAEMQQAQLRKETCLIRRLLLVGLVILAATSVFAASPQAVPDTQSGLQVAIDPATGKLRQPTAEEVQQIAKSFNATLRLHPLVPRVSANGAVSVELDDSFANFYIARMTDEGGLVFDCVNDPASALRLLTTPAAQSIMWRGAAAPSTKTPVVLEEK